MKSTTTSERKKTKMEPMIEQATEETKPKSATATVEAPDTFFDDVLASTRATSTNVLQELENLSPPERRQKMLALESEDPRKLLELIDLLHAKKRAAGYKSDFLRTTPLGVWREEIADRLMKELERPSALFAEVAEALAVVRRPDPIRCADRIADVTDVCVINMTGRAILLGSQRGAEVWSPPGDRFVFFVGRELEEKVRASVALTKSTRPRSEGGDVLDVFSLSEVRDFEALANRYRTPGSISSRAIVPEQNQLLERGLEYFLNGVRCPKILMAWLCSADPENLRGLHPFNLNMLSAPVRALVRQLKAIDDSGRNPEPPEAITFWKKFDELAKSQATDSAESAAE